MPFAQLRTDILGPVKPEVEVLRQIIAGRAVVYAPRLTRRSGEGFEVLSDMGFQHPSAGSRGLDDHRSHRSHRFAGLLFTLLRVIFGAISGAICWARWTHRVAFCRRGRNTSASAGRGRRSVALFFGSAACPACLGEERIQHAGERGYTDRKSCRRGRLKLAIARVLAGAAGSAGIGRVGIGRHQIAAAGFMIDPCAVTHQPNGLA